MTDFELLTTKEMREKYGLTIKNKNEIKLDKNKIPEKLWSLIPYAEFWGISDDLIRDDLVKNAPKDLIKNLSYIVKKYDNELDEWLVGPEADSLMPSNEYIAFSAMRMIVDFL